MEDATRTSTAPSDNRGTTVHPDPSMGEFRALLQCVGAGETCLYCMQPSRTFVVEHPDGPHPAAEAALQYGQERARNVFGASVHRVLVEGRPAGPWQSVPVVTPMDRYHAASEAVRAAFEESEV
jgi:hypothetical protein